ncbi:MAG: hypothetical protein ACRD0P_04555 [Stackebrandtia sp.]
MGIYADRMRALNLTFTSPDGKVAARLTNNTNMALSFQPNAYREYKEGSLEIQLTALMRLAHAGRRRAHMEALSESMMKTAGRPAEPPKDWQLSQKQLKFRNKHAELESRGKSQNDVLRVLNTGMRNWEVRIKPGTLDKTTEDEFKREFTSAIANMMTDYRFKIADLKQAVYGHPTPDSGRRRLWPVNGTLLAIPARTIYDFDRPPTTRTLE